MGLISFIFSWVLKVKNGGGGNGTMVNWNRLLDQQEKEVLKNLISFHAL